MPPIPSAELSLRQSFDQQSDQHTCHGWTCLSGAARFGIILVTIMVIFTLALIYWRLKATPDRRPKDEERISKGESRQVSRARFCGVTIIIDRVRWPASSQEDNKNMSGARRAQVKGSVRPVPRQINAGSSDIHMVPLTPLPPPPPPVFWAVATTPSMLPPPPPFGPSSLYIPGPPPARVRSRPLAVDLATAPRAPDAPPPYSSQATDVPSAFTWTSAVVSRPPSGGLEEQPQLTPLAKVYDQGRWLAKRNVFPRSGHARTISDSGSASPVPATRSPSGSDSPPTPERGRSRSSHSSKRRPRQPHMHPPAQHEQRSQNPSTRGQGGNETPAQSGLSASPINTSTEAVCGSQLAQIEYSRQDSESPNPGERRQCSRRGVERRHSFSDYSPFRDKLQEYLARG
ncbi:hypothetical protein VTK56DRAFT_4035 [Thermocarpiscus australiensis]